MAGQQTRPAPEPQRIRGSPVATRTLFIGREEKTAVNPKRPRAKARPTRAARPRQARTKKNPAESPEPKQEPSKVEKPPPRAADAAKATRRPSAAGRRKNGKRAGRSAPGREPEAAAPRSKWLNMAVAWSGGAASSSTTSLLRAAESSYTSCASGVAQLRFIRRRDEEVIWQYSRSTPVTQRPAG